MLSLPGTLATSKLFLVSFTNLLVLLLFLSPSAVHGVALRDPKMWGSEPGFQRGGVPAIPDVDMLKALEYIESLRPKGGADAQQHGPLSAGYDPRHTEDAEKLRAMLRLAPDPTQSRDEEGEEEEEEEGEGEDRSAELLQAVLTTLRQAEKASEQDSRGPSAGEGAKRDQRPAARQKPPRIPLHKKLPLMFEDSEEGEGSEEEADEPSDAERGGHFKRTNENVEEKYTPQTLATLQSVFDELDKMSRGEAVNKRQGQGDVGEEEEEEEEDGGVFKVRTVAYDDMDGEQDPAPLQDQDEEEEEEEEEEEGGDNKQDVGRELDYDDNNGAMDEDAEEEEDEGYAVKRSSDPDDFANLVDYYLLKVLEKTEEEEQKREEEEEEEQRAERRAAQAQLRDHTLPRMIYEFIQISQKYQIPPDDLLDMLRTGEIQNQLEPPKPDRIHRAQSAAPRFKTKTLEVPEAALHGRHRSPGGQSTQEILKVLGFGPTDHRAPVRKPKQYESWPSRRHTPPAARSRESTPTQRRLPATFEDGGDNTVDEDELMAYLAAQVPTRYPRPAHNGEASRERDEAGRSATGAFEQAIRDFFDHMESETSQKGKRQSEDAETGGDAQTQDFENEAVMKLLSYMSDTEDKRV